MIESIEDLRSGGVLPTGPVSAWPKSRNIAAASMAKSWQANSAAENANKITTGLGKMAAGLIRTTGQAIMNGKVSAEIREERYDTCKQCNYFIEESKRCSECGCFMEAKTWVGGDPNMLCPKSKWKR
jgi:hypothetical protein